VQLRYGDVSLTSLLNVSRTIVHYLYKENTIAGTVFKPDNSGYYGMDGRKDVTLQDEKLASERA